MHRETKSEGQIHHFHHSTPMQSSFAGHPCCQRKVSSVQPHNRFNNMNPYITGNLYSVKSIQQPGLGLSGQNSAQLQLKRRPTVALKKRAVGMGLGIHKSGQ